MLSEDTSPEIEQMQIELLRRMPVARKLELVAQMNQSMRTRVLAGLRRRYPDENETQIRRRLADLLLGDELAARAYGPAPHISSAEDIILARLAQYSSSGEMSGYQWRDVLGVLRVQGDRLDRDYMRDMASTLDVADLLERALGEVG